MTQPATDPMMTLMEALDTYVEGEVERAVSAVGKATDELLLDRARVRAIAADLRSRLSPQPPKPAGWTRTTFWDNFGDGLSNFHVRDGTTQNNTFCNNFARNVAVKDGVLVIRGQRERTMVLTNSGTRTCDYTSGYLDTSTNRLPLSRGIGMRLEVRALLPTMPGKSTGIWPAPGWVRSRRGKGEADLAEAWGEPTAGANALATKPEIYRVGSFSSSCYADTNNPSLGKRSNWGTPGNAMPIIAQAIHTFWMEWDEVGMRFGLDGNLPHLDVRYADTPWLAPAFPVSTDPAQGPDLELRMNLQIGQAYWGLPDPHTTELPVEMLISSVRILGR